MKMASERSRARATSPEQMCCPSKANENLPPVNRLTAILTIVRYPYG